MSAATTILYKPTTIFTLSSRPRSPKTRFGPELTCPRRLLFSGEPVFKKRVSVWDRRTLVPNTMAASAQAGGASRGSSGEEGVGALEQEGFVNGSSDFASNFVGGGLESTLNKLSKWVVTVFFGLVLIWRHDAAALWAAMGAVLNAWLSTVLKQLLNQERPVSTIRPDPGMPSSHAQAIFFSITFAVLSLVEWLGVNAFTMTLGALALALGAYLSWLRVALGFHTLSQIVVGATLGLLFCIAWFWTWNAIVLEAFIFHLWVRVIVVLGACGFCIGFLSFVIRYWIKDEELSL